jgi:hypothetical protein
VPFTVDGLILAASMLILDANLAHGLGHGPIGALVSAWPALALAGSFELLMTLVRTGRGGHTATGACEPGPQPVPALEHPVPPALP